MDEKKFGKFIRNLTQEGQTAEIVKYITVK